MNAIYTLPTAYVSDPRLASKRGTRTWGTGLRVGRVRFYEKIEIVGKARLRVKDNRVTSYNEVLNAMGTEGGQKVFVVLVYQVRSSIP